MRVPVELVCADWDEPVRLETADLSPRGCFLPARVLVEQGTPVVVSFRIGDGGDEWTIFGEVSRVSSWRRRSDPQERGMGVRFLGTGPWERIRIRERLRGVPPPLPRRGPPPLPDTCVAS
ncbi:MAG: PilZ domain-containing protein [Deltaproteobacteria bacterium]|nr:PilZ domain-containing protein [Deltaproteobacteria bacterium]